MNQLVVFFFFREKLNIVLYFEIAGEYSSIILKILK